MESIQCDAVYTVNSQYLLAKESKAEGIEAQKLDFSFRKTSKDKEAKPASFLEPLSLLSPSPSCAHSIDTLLGSQIPLSVLKWSRNMEFLKIFKYINHCQKKKKKTEQGRVFCICSLTFRSSGTRRHSELNKLNFRPSFMIVKPHRLAISFMNFLKNHSFSGSPHLTSLFCQP